MAVGLPAAVARSKQGDIGQSFGSCSKMTCTKFWSKQGDIEQCFGRCSKDDMYKNAFSADHFNPKFWLLWENDMYKIAFLADSFNSLAIQRRLLFPRLHKQKIFSFHFSEISCLLREVSLLGKKKV